MIDTLATMEWHWLRPLWLWSLLPTALIAVLLLRQPISTSRWNRVIDENLLPALLQGNATRYAPWPIGCLLAGWLLAVLALAGPSWEKTESNALEQADAVVVILDLSPSMLVKDVPPTRLQAAQFKILDLLKQRHEGYTALVAYSGSAHVVAPLSDDSNTIAALVPSLEPGIMPKMGSQVEEAFAVALGLLDNAHFERGRLLLLTDGVVPEAVEKIAGLLENKAVTLHVIGVGTPEGGPIPLERGGYVKDGNGQPQLFPFSPDTLKTLASNHGGDYSDLRLDDADIAPLVSLPPWLASLDNNATRENNQIRETNQTLEHWQDNGYWLLFPLLLVSLFAFRRGLVVGIIPLLLVITPEHSHALDWESFWYTPDQRAKQKMDANDPAAAAQLFEDPQWKAYAEYQSGQHEQAAEHFASSQTPEALYNRGNALAKNGQLEDAAKSYDEALKLKEGFADAEANRELVRKLIEQQKQQHNNNPDNQGDSQQQSGEQQSPEQQSPEQQDQQSQDQQSQEQQSQSSRDGQPSEQQQDQQQQDQQQSGQQPSDQQQDGQQNSHDPQKQDSAQAGDQGNGTAEQQPPDAAEKARQQQAEDDAKRAAEAKAGKPDASAQDANASAEGTQETPEEAEKRQATEQWLRKVPDDPGGLLRNKFDYYYQQNQREEGRKRRSGTSSEEEPRW